MRHGHWLTTKSDRFLLKPLWAPEFLYWPLAVRWPANVLLHICSEWRWMRLSNNLQKMTTYRPLTWARLPASWACSWAWCFPVGRWPLPCLCGFPASSTVPRPTTRSHTHSETHLELGHGNNSPVNKNISCSVYLWHYLIYSVSQKIPPEDLWQCFQNGWEFFNQILHAYYAFLSTPVYGFLFNYLQLWRSYAILSVTTQFTSCAQKCPPSAKTHAGIFWHFS